MENRNITKSYYSIIPANVRYDKELTPNAKLLYGEITALCNENGFCWANNDYFANLYGVSKTSISKWINDLVKKGYISSELIYKEDTKQIEDRYIRIVNEPIKENLNTPIEEKLNRGIKENLKDNNTLTNNTNNNKENIIKEIFDFWNEQNIIIHRELSSELKKVINNTLKKYDVEEIKKCILRYGNMYHSEYEYCKYKWSLEKFLKQSNGLKDFTDEGTKWNNYLQWKNNNKISNKNNSMYKDGILQVGVDNSDSDDVF